MLSNMFNFMQILIWPEKGLIVKLNNELVSFNLRNCLRINKDCWRV